MKLKAKWIWKKQSCYNTYNDSIIARKTFRVGEIKSALMAVTTDTWYRLCINGQWVNDGPCRSWPAHYQYDILDVTVYLQKGLNTIEIIARYFGTGDMHHIPIQAGLLCQLDLKLKSGKTKTIYSDSSWQVAKFKPLKANSPKQCVQMEAVENYDARLESKCRFEKACVLFDTHKGPWKDLNPRDVAILTKTPFAFKTHLRANIIRPQGTNYTIPASRILRPGIIEMNSTAAVPVGMATVIKIDKKTTIEISSGYFSISIDGKKSRSGKFTLQKGRHILIAFRLDPCCFSKDMELQFKSDDFELSNPIQPKHKNPWCFIPFKEFAFLGNDIYANWFYEKFPENLEKTNLYTKQVEKIFRTVKDERSFHKQLSGRAKCMPLEKMFTDNFHWMFENKEVVASADKFVESPSALMYDNPEYTTVRPSADGDIELVYDLGEQNCGYYSFELIADAGVILDFSGIEHIAESGQVQHTGLSYLHSMRYITKQGLNKFTSLRRRSGRYIFITMRNQKKPVRFRKIELIESTYPVNYVSSFNCSDSRLDKIWDISARTMKLCMEDVFTDCPLYEQSLWVGDARNEALFAYTMCGAEDLAKRFLRLSALSLEKYNLVTCHLPSCFEAIIPVWSFLWSIAVWDYYWFTGDKKVIKEYFPYMMKNLKNAAGMLDERDLFSAPHWNLFDWTPIDYQHKVVTHNNMFMIGAIDSALKCASAAGITKHNKYLKDLRKKINKAVNKLWDNNKRSYIDSIHDDGTPSSTISHHTNFLSILYDVVEKKNLPEVIKNTTSPRKQMVKIGSPFAIQYLFETYEKLGIEDKIIKSIYDNYLQMLDADATTVWETFEPIPELTFPPFKTRSHCHGWSAAPVYFLNRIILGIKQTSIGCGSFDISPRLNGLTSARGAINTIYGPLYVSWNIEKKDLQVKISAPEGVKTRFVKNDTHKDLNISVKY